MRRRLFAIGRTDVYLHPATLLAALYAYLSGLGPALLTAFLSILLHECAHALAAALAGEPPMEMELTPLGAVLRLEDEERLPPIRRLLMLAAGPVMTLLMCFAAIWLTQAQLLPAQAGRTLFMANLAILLMNLLPALPLDGGRMLYMALGYFLRAETARRLMRAMGTALGLAGIGGSLWLAWRYGSWNLSLAAAGCFLMYSAAQATTAQAMAELRMLMDRKILLEKRGHLRLQTEAVLGSESLRRAVRLLSPTRLTAFVVLQPGSMERIGLMTEQQLISAYLDRPQQTCREACTGAPERQNAQNAAKSDQKA